MRPTTVLILLAGLLPACWAQPAPRTQWWQEARFGMFIHWGVYAIPARGEWVMNNEKIPIPEYEKFYREFNPTGFNADQWVELAQSAGMKYMVITSKHHDGFCNFDSRLTDYKAPKTPGGKDYIGLLSKSAAAHKMPLGFYYSLLDWHHPDYRGNFPRYLDYAFGQVRELCTRYGNVAVIWFDGGWEHSAADWRAEELCAMIRKLQPKALINDRAGIPEDFGTPEQTVPGAAPSGGRLWETCMTINGNWGYNASDSNYKSVPALVQMLADIASKGGNLLLNVGPRADGTIQPEFVERLKGMGAWLAVHGEGIYGTKGGPFRPQPWGRCTSKVDSDGNLLYFHLFDVPKDGKVTVTGLTTRVLRTRLVSTGAKVPFEQKGSTLTFELPDKGRDPIDTVVAARLAGPPVVESPAIRPGDDGVVTLLPGSAEIHGSRLQVENRNGPNFGFWVDAKDYPSWTVELPSEATYEVRVLQACPPGSGGSYEVTAGDSRVAGTVRNTSTWEDYVEVVVGKLTVPKGKQAICLKPTKLQSALMNLRSVRLSPVTP